MAPSSPYTAKLGNSPITPGDDGDLLRELSPELTTNDTIRLEIDSVQGPNFYYDDENVAWDKGVFSEDDDHIICKGHAPSDNIQIINLNASYSFDFSNVKVYINDFLVKFV